MTYPGVDRWRVWASYAAYRGATVAASDMGKSLLITPLLRHDTLRR